MKTVLKDIKIIENSNLNHSNNKSNIWPDTTQINSASPRIIAHYVIQNLGYLISNDPDFMQSLDNQFKQWNPGNMNDDVVEKHIFSLYGNNPVDYWNEMLKCERWRNLAQIALRIINIPPTEAACERMFSARREIMTKHISNIRDNVVEARAYLKAG